MAIAEVVDILSVSVFNLDVNGVGSAFGCEEWKEKDCNITNMAARRMHDES